MSDRRSFRRSKRPKKAPPIDIVKPASNYQVSRSLPDLRGNLPDGFQSLGDQAMPGQNPAGLNPAGPKKDGFTSFAGRSLGDAARPSQPQSQSQSQPPAKASRKASRKAKKAAKAAQLSGGKAAGKKRNIPWKKLFKRTGLALLIILILVGGWLGYKVLRNSNKIGAGFWGLFDNSKLKGEDRGRVNILLAGNSADDPGHAGGNLTDSIMLVSLNVKDNTAFMLSIPRDLYVNVPGDGYAKINSVYQTGNQTNFSQSGYPDGGMGLLEKVVASKLDVPIDYYALINYTAFRDSVNAVGGVTVNIKSQNPYGLYDPFTNLKLPNGRVKLNGQQALNLARSRGDGPGAYGFYRADFDRTANQRMLLVALKDKSTSAGVFANPVKISNLLDALGNNVKTDLSLGNMRRLYDLGQKVDSKNIKSVGLNDADGKDLLTSYTSRDGQSTLIPAAGINDYSDIQAFVAKLSKVSADK